MAEVVTPNENYLSAILVSLVLHVAIVGLLVFSFRFGNEPEQVAAAKIIDAEIVDTGVLEAIEAEKRRKQQAIEEQKRRQEDQRRQEELRRQQEQQRIEQERQAKIAEQKRIAEEKRVAEQKRIAEEMRIVEEKRQAEEAERKRIEEQKRLEAAKIAEEKRRAEEQRLLEEQQRAEWERLQAEEADAAAQARSRELAGKRALYIDSIRHKVERNWIRPVSAQLGDTCTVNVLQIPGGDVVDVSVESCIGDAVFQRSVEAAVRKAAPLPDPPEPALFDRQIQFTFKVKD